MGKIAGVLPGVPSYPLSPHCQEKSLGEWTRAAGDPSYRLLPAGRIKGSLQGREPSNVGVRHSADGADFAFCVFA